MENKTSPYAFTIPALAMFVLVAAPLKAFDVFFSGVSSWCMAQIQTHLAGYLLILFALIVWILVTLFIRHGSHLDYNEAKLEALLLEVKAYRGQLKAVADDVRYNIMEERLKLQNATDRSKYTAEVHQIRLEMKQDEIRYHYNNTASLVSPLSDDFAAFAEKQYRNDPEIQKLSNQLHSTISDMFYQ